MESMIKNIQRYQPKADDKEFENSRNMRIKSAIQRSLKPKNHLIIGTDIVVQKLEF